MLLHFHLAREQGTEELLCSLQSVAFNCDISFVYMQNISQEDVDAQNLNVRSNTTHLIGQANGGQDWLSEGGADWT